MATPFIGQITLFGGNFAVRGYAFCDGQVLSISQNDALFSLLGTTYGGDGVTTFALPDMRGRLPVHQGQLAGGGLYQMGQRAGTETVTLTVPELPAHSHGVTASAVAGTVSDPGNQFWARESSGEVGQFSSAIPGGVMSPSALGKTGGSQPHENVQPFLCVNFIIALEGVYPSRN